MGSPMFKTLTGAVDGVNTTFSFGAAFTAGTAVVLLNGQVALHSAGNPWSESAPLGLITFDPFCVPRTGDVVAGFAIDTSEDGPVTTRGEAVLVLAGDRRISCVVERAPELTLSLERADVTAILEPSEISLITIGHAETIEMGCE